MSSRIGARRLKVVLGLGVLVLGTLGGTFGVFLSAAEADSVNQSCPAGTTEYKIDSNPLSGLSNGESAQFTVNGQTFTFTKVIGPSPFEDDTFDFTSTIAVSVVLVKAGPDTNVYNYDPPTTSGSGLHPPLNSGGQAPAVSHVSFCAGVSTTTTTVPEETTTTTVPEETTTTTVPEETTTTTVPEETTTTTVPEETTTTTVPEETTTTTVPEETTTTLRQQGSTTIFTTTTQPQSTTTLAEQGGTVPTTTPVPVTVTGDLPRTGSGVAFPALFALSCIAGGVLLVASRRRSWSRP